MGRFANLDLDSTPPVPRREPVIDVWPNEDENICLQKGDALFAQGAYESALAAYSRALRFSRDLDGAWVGQVRCLICLGEYPEAILWSDRGMERLRNTPDLLAGKGLAMVLRGNRTEGMSYLDSAVEMRSPSPWVWLARGEALLASGLPEVNAQRCFLKAVELAPKDALLEVRIGLIYNRHRKYARALPALNSAARTIADNALLFYQIGLAQEALGDPALAAGNYQRSLAIQPRYPDAENALARLRSGNWFTRLFQRLVRRRG